MTEKKTFSLIVVEKNGKQFLKIGPVLLRQMRILEEFLGGEIVIKSGDLIIYTSDKIEKQYDYRGLGGPSVVWQGCGFGESQGYICANDLNKGDLVEITVTSDNNFFETEGHRGPPFIIYNNFSDFDLENYYKLSYARSLTYCQIEDEMKFDREEMWSNARSEDEKKEFIDKVRKRLYENIDAIKLSQKEFIYS